MGYERFADRNDAVSIVKKSKDFRVRQHKLPSRSVIYLFICLWLGVTAAISFLSADMLMMPDDSPTPITDILKFMGVVTFLVLVISIIASSLLQRARNTVMETEFLSLVFANSATLDSEFCLVANHDKDVVYYNNGFDNLFTASEDFPNNFDRFIAHKGITDADKQKLERALDRGDMEKVTFKDGKTELEITMQPLPRPAGYSIIRGYRKES